jgi:hypothetical protein
VNFPKEAIGERESAAQSFQAMIERGDVIGDLRDVVEGNPRRLFHFKQEEIGKRRLRPFDLGRKNGLLADVGVKEELRVGEKGRSAVESSERHESPFDGFAKAGIV